MTTEDWLKDSRLINIKLVLVLPSGFLIREIV